MSEEALLAHLPAVTAAIARGDEPATGRLARRAVSAGVPAAAVYEAALQTYLFAGYPRAISGLAAVARVCGPAKKPLSPGSPASWKRQGARLCRRIYASATEKMLSNMRAIHPAIAEWIVWEGYGKVLSRPGLSAAVREACAVSALVALGAWRQLESHARGALRVGLPLDVLRAVAGREPEARRIVREAAGEIMPNPRRRRSLKLRTR